jgi:hypothetical protein
LKKGVKIADWVVIDGFPKYSVNRLGQVRRDSFNRLVHPQMNQTHNVYVPLSREGKLFQRSLALIVARTFLPEPIDPFNTPINLDGNRWNCRVDNLMWRPRWFAIRYHQQFEDPYQRPVKGPLRARDEKEVFPDSLSAACRYGLLERDVVMSIEHNTYAWPTYQIFELV